MKRLVRSSLLLCVCYLWGATMHAQQNIRLNNDMPGRLQENPSIAIDSSGIILVSWSDQRSGAVEIYLARSTDGGATWQAETRVSSSSARPTGGMEMGPNIAAAPAGGVYINWADIRRPPAWDRVDVCVARSADGGASFSGDPRINNDSIKSQHQPAIAVGDDGTVYAAWHGFPDAGDPEATPVFVARSLDGGTTFEPQRRADVYGAKTPGNVIGSCNCCRPWIFTGTGGNVYVVYRIDSANYRDIFLAHSTDRGLTWAPVVRVSSGRWLFNACPGSGPVGAMRAGALYVAWMEERDAKRSIFLARSPDGGATFEPDVRVTDDGNFPSLAVDVRGHVFMGWSDNQPKPSLHCAVSTDGGRSFGAPRVVNDAPPRVGNIGISCAAAPNGRVYGVWKDARRDAGDIMFADLTSLMAASSVPGESAGDEEAIAIVPQPARANRSFDIIVKKGADGLPRDILVMDMMGRTVATVPGGQGRHPVTLDASGVFFIVARYDATRNVRARLVVR